MHIHIFTGILTCLPPRATSKKTTGLAALPLLSAILVVVGYCIWRAVIALKIAGVVSMPPTSQRISEFCEHPASRMEKCPPRTGHFPRPERMCDLQFAVALSLVSVAQGISRACTAEWGQRNRIFLRALCFDDSRCIIHNPGWAGAFAFPVGVATCVRIAYIGW